MTRKVTIRHVAGCPGLELLKERLPGPVAEDDVAFELIATPEDAARVGFYGSPTILINGTDPFPVAGTPSLSCRLYWTEQGAEPAPSISQLTEALNAQK
ncbi:MAG: thioredoxin family protein [Acidimicrobiia bacterium]|nr:thioredoxin family protein [Acidimicrobiia bacterium]